MLITLLVSPLFAQKFYFKGQIGYDIGFLKSQQVLQSETFKDYYDSTVTNYFYQACRSSYATGVSFNAGFGIMITKYLSAELTGFYTICRKQLFTTTIKIEDELGYHFNATNEYIMKGGCYGLKTGLTFTLPGKEFRPYSRLGAILSILSMKESMKMHIVTDHPNYLPFGGMEYNLEYKTRFGLGMNLAIGLEYMFLKRLWVYAEAEGTILNYMPTGASYTSYIVSRKDITSLLTVHEKEIRYVESYGDPDNQSQNEPTKRMPVKFSFSSIGFNIGLKYTLFD